MEGGGLNLECCAEALDLYPLHGPSGRDMEEIHQAVSRIPTSSAKYTRHFRESASIVGIQIQFSLL
jgi:hypothetical protein